MKRIAVLAHYDIDGIGDPYLGEVFNSLLNVVDAIVVITTSGIEGLPELLDDKVTVIQRDNVGYDFFSYKTGIDSIENINELEQLIVLNDSFYINSNFNLKFILEKSSKFDVFGITENKQFAYHLQSYFLVFNKAALQSSWFYSFWNKVYKYKNKWKIVIDYEVGLTTAAIDSGLKVGSLIESTADDNICHSDPVMLIEKVGMLKIDVIRNSIYKIDLNEHFKNSSIIERHIARTKKSYKNSLLNTVDKTSRVGTNFFEFDNSRTKCEAAVILHLFYVDLALELRSVLSRIPFNVDIYITVVDEKFIPQVVDMFSGIANRLCIGVTENRGRDVRPFVEVLSCEDFACYDLVLKLHSKKSKYSDAGSEWRDELYKGLVPSSSTVNKIKQQFINANVGVASSHSSYLSSDKYWGANKERTFDYCDKLGLDLNDRELFFIGGTMFWFSPKAIYPLVNLMDLDLFEEEAGQQDGTLAHVFERLVCKSVQSAGMDCVDILNPTLALTNTDVLSNTVRVLDD